MTADIRTDWTRPEIAALFDLARDAGTLDTVHQDLTDLKRLLGESGLGGVPATEWSHDELVGQRGLQLLGRGCQGGHSEGRERSKAEPERDATRGELHGR